MRWCCSNDRITSALAWACVVVLIVGIIFIPALVTGDNAKSIKILVPLKLGFQEFVTWISTETPATNATLSFSGFSIEVFQRCVEKLNYTLNYTFVGYGDGINDPTYDGVLQALVDSEDMDGVVADMTITKDRWQNVDFTQPYVQSSLRMVVPLQRSTSSTDFWIFLAPFSIQLWLAILALFFATILSLFLLERTDTSKRRAFWTILWYTTMAVFFSQREDVKSRLGRLLTIFWLVVVLIFTSSYTASLSSILAAQQPRPTIANFVDLQKSHLSIGHQGGSFVSNYIMNTLYVTPGRLVELVSEDGYDRALRSGNVSAIIDESPYLETFLTTYGCQYTALDTDIAYFGGFGFAFKKASSLTKDFSLAIISLEQSRDLQNLKNKWLGSGQCISDTATTNISLSSFGGLFIIVIILYIGCLIGRLVKLIRGMDCGEESRAEDGSHGCNSSLGSWKRKLLMVIRLSRGGRVGSVPVDEGHGNDQIELGDPTISSIQLRSPHRHSYNVVPIDTTEVV